MNLYPILVVCAALLIGCGPTQAQPQQVLLIRHAEKSGDIDDIHINAQGQKRAEALPKLFEKSFAKPDFIFAAKQSKHSNRCVETVTPLAKHLNLKIHDKFEDNEFGELANELLTNPKYANKVVLVCWHHGNLPDLATKLKATDVPHEWKDAVFDRVWLITYGDSGKVKFTKRHQMLLLGDAKE